eukprot:Hpha_TRINITY_DN15487_c3_g2::TRINITY_DN15487_c3_g2_i1::g.177351::m.177351
MPKSAEDVQRRSFTKWLNLQIARSNYSEKAKTVEVLEDDLQDGEVLLYLVAATTGVPMPNKWERFDKGKRTEIRMLQNLDMMIGMTQQAKIKLIGIGAKDICDKDSRSVLALLWAIIYAQQIGSIQGEDSKSGGKEGLLLWVRRAVAGYDGCGEIRDFKKSWVDGNALAALIHKHSPDVVDYDEVRKMSAIERIEYCIKGAEEKLKIPALIEAADMEQGLDDKSVMTYISEFFRYYSEKQTAGQAQKRVVQFVEAQKRIDTFVWEFEKRSQEFVDFAQEETKRISALPPVPEKLGAADLVSSQKRLAAANQFSKSELVQKRLMKSQLEGTLSSLQTALSCNGRPQYETPVSPARLDELWDELANAAEKEVANARAAYRETRELVTADYKALSSGLAKAMERIHKELSDLAGDDPEKLLEGVVPLQEQHAALAKDLESCREAADLLAAAKVNLDDVSGVDHSVEDIDYSYGALKGAIERKEKLFKGQLEQKKGSSVSAEKLAMIAETFSFFDKNRSGTLARDEFIGALTSLGRNYTNEEAVKLYEQNKTKGEEMSTAEFTEFMKNLEASNTTGPEDVIKSLGALCEGEVTLEKLKEAIGPEAAEYMWKQAPAKEDGSRDLKAYFQNAFTKVSAPAHAPPPSASVRRRGKSMRAEAVETPLGDADPPSDTEE